MLGNKNLTMCWVFFKKKKRKGCA